MDQPSNNYLLEHQIKINTMTITCNLTSNINLKLLEKYLFVNNPEFTLGKKGFMNSINVKMQVHGKCISIKFFKSLILTCGCRTLEDFESVMNELINILKKGTNILDGDGNSIHVNYVIGTSELSYTNMNIILCSISFKLDIDFSELSEKIFEPLDTWNNYHMVSDNNRINIRYKNNTSKTSIIIFKSGIVIIASKNPNQVMEAHQYLINNI